MSVYAPPERRERGHGVGIELDATMVRGVLLSPDAPGRVARVASVPLDGSTADQIVDGMTRLALELNVLHQNIPTRVAWHTRNNTIQSVDITGRDRTAWSRIRRDALDDADAAGSIVVTAGARTVLHIVTWDELTAEIISTSAASAGLGQVVIEPAPFSATRVCPPGTAFVRRGDADGCWAATIHDGIVGLYGTIDPGAYGPPPLWEAVSPPQYDGVPASRADLIFMNPPTSHHLQVGRMLSHIHDQVAHFPRWPREASIDLVGDIYPNFPAEDPHSVEHIAIALGAGLGAAGLHTRWRIVERNFEVWREVPAWTLPWGLEPIEEPVDHWAEALPPPPQRRLFGRAHLG